MLNSFRDSRKKIPFFLLWLFFKTVYPVDVLDGFLFAPYSPASNNNLLIPNVLRPLCSIKFKCIKWKQNPGWWHQACCRIISILALDLAYRYKHSRSTEDRIIIDLHVNLLVVTGGCAVFVCVCRFNGQWQRSDACDWFQGRGDDLQSDYRRRLINFATLSWYGPAARRRVAEEDGPGNRATQAFGGVISDPPPPKRTSCCARRTRLWGRIAPLGGFERWTLPPLVFHLSWSSKASEARHQACNLTQIKLT